MGNYKCIFISNPPGGEGNTPKTILARHQKNSPDGTLNCPPAAIQNTKNKKGVLAYVYI